MFVDVLGDGRPRKPDHVWSLNAHQHLVALVDVLGDRRPRQLDHGWSLNIRQRLRQLVNVLLQGAIS